MRPRPFLHLSAAGSFALAVAACSRPAAEPAPHEKELAARGPVAAAPPAPGAASAAPPPTPDAAATTAPSAAPSGVTAPDAASAVWTDRLTRPEPERLVAIGDLHGDLDAARRALRLAGATDARGAWAGGKLVVVQTGDEIDRGDDDRAVLDLFERLKGEARAAGGEVIALCGNHELMNVERDFRYVTPGSLAAFVDAAAPADVASTDFAATPAPARARAAAFSPGRAYAEILARRPLFARVGASVFVHGGVLAKHVRYGLGRIDAEVEAWLRGRSASPPRAATSEDGPAWTRAYSAAPGKEECDELAAVLASTGARRMVMGHTVQRGGISSACDGRAWRIDVGMSRAFGGPVQVLEIRGDRVAVLKE